MREAERFNLPCDTCDKSLMCLTAKEKEVGSIMFDREYRTKPRAASSSLFPFAVMEPNLDDNAYLLETFNKDYQGGQNMWVVSGWDLAWSEKAGGDYLAKVTASFDMETGIKTILDIDRWQKLSFEQQCKLIEHHNERYNEDIIVIESDSAQMIWAQYLEQKTTLPILRHRAAGKKDLQSGVPGLLMDLERKVWRIPYNPKSRNMDNVKAFLTEAEAFGWKNDKLEGVGEHDDLVMAWWHCNFGLERYKKISSWGAY